MVPVLFIAAFLLGIDQFSLSRILYRPLIACTIIGLILGNVSQGIIVGTTLEMLLVGYQAERDGMMTGETGGFLLFSIVITVFVISSGMSTAAAVGAASSLTAIGVYINYALLNVNTLFLPLARKAAGTANEKKLAAANFIPMLLTGIVYGGLAAAAYLGGSALTDTLSSLSSNAGWVLNAFAVAGMLMPCIGLAVLMRNIGYEKRKGMFFAGVAAGAVMILVSAKSGSLLLCAVAAFSIAAFEYRIDSKNDDDSERSEKSQTIKQNEVKGGAQKWW